MAGTKSRSGGRNRLPVDLHLARGTYRADRHSSAQSVVALPQLTTTEPSEALLAGLADEGRSFLRAVYAEYAVTEMEGLVLRLAAEGLDDAAVARQRGDAKSARAAVRQVLAVLQRLGLPAAKAV